MTPVSMKDVRPKEDMGSSPSTQGQPTIINVQPLNSTGTSLRDAIANNDKLKEELEDEIKKLKQELKETK